MNVLTFGCDSYTSLTRLRQLDSVYHFLSEIRLVVSITNLRHLIHLLGSTHFLGRFVIQVGGIHQFKHGSDQSFELGKPEHLGIVFEIFDVTLDEQHPLLDGGSTLELNSVRVRLGFLRKKKGGTERGFEPRTFGL